MLTYELVSTMKVKNKCEVLFIIQAGPLMGHTGVSP